MDKPEYILNEINKGIKMGMHSISTISDKVTDSNFKNELQYQYNKYNEILNQVNNELEKYDEFPKEVNPAQKIMGWIDIQMSTLNDQSNSKIAEMLLKGTNMQIIEGVKLLNHNQDNEESIKNILNNFIKFQENNVEDLKSICNLVFIGIFLFWISHSLRYLKR